LCVPESAHSLVGETENMAARSAPAIAIFFVAGLCAAGLSLLLGWWFLPLIFLGDGLVLLALLASAFALCRKLNWTEAASTPRRYWEAAALLALGYPAAELFGVLMALACEALLLATPTHWHAAHEPLLWIGLLAFWGSLGAAFCMNVALMVLRDRWDKRTLALLVVAGIATTATALSIYAPRYDATEGFAANYRELLLFGVLLPLGNVLYSVLAGYGLTRRT
jgi:hypothetical protein